MIRHIVMWKIAPSEDKAARAAAIKEHLEALMDKISVIRDIEVGINVNSADSISDVVLVSSFDTLDALNEYQNHPAHKAVGAAYVKPYVCERRVCDYEF